LKIAEPWQVSAGLSYIDPLGWRASARLRWLAKSWGDNDNTLPVDAHAVVDASVAYALEIERSVREDRNLFNQRYIAANDGIKLAAICRCYCNHRRGPEMSALLP
jgi:outer membrane receptor protein involved in Fe transport